MDPSEYENIARVEGQHWWYRGMAAISLSLLAPYLGGHGTANRSLRILDAGCGPGGMLRRLAELGVPIGLDVHPLALELARRRLPGDVPLVRASVTQLPMRSDSVDLIVSFDVLYHRAVGDDCVALSEFCRVLRPGGTLLIRLPALEALRGAHDEVVHTRHRFTRSELRTKLQAAGFRIRRVTYANTLLFPIVFLRRRFLQADTAASDVELPSPLVNWLLAVLLRAERVWLTRFDLPIGVSVCAVAAKPAPQE
jgi:SAM-dependent methyltransferase